MLGVERASGIVKPVATGIIEAPVGSRVDETAFGRGNDVPGRSVIVVSPHRVGAGVQQRNDRYAIPRTCRNMQGRGAGLVRSVKVGFVRDEHMEHFRLLHTAGGTVQGRVAAVVAVPHVRARFQEDSGVAGVTHHVQRRHASVRSDKRVGTCSNERLEHSFVPVSRGRGMKRLSLARVGTRAARVGIRASAEQRPNDSYVLTVRGGSVQWCVTAIRARPVVRARLDERQD